MKFDQTLERLEQQYFIGRDHELQVFSDMMTGRSPRRILNIYGPGGVGKTFLLRGMQRQAEMAGALVLKLDADDFDASIRGFSEGFQAALQEHDLLTGRSIDPSQLGDAFAALELIAAGMPVVIIIDTYEVIQHFDHWLRERFVRNLPAKAVTVIAGRNPLGGGWVASPAWRSLVQSISLQAFTSEQTADYLARFDIVEAGLVSSIHRFTQGHPLSLSLAAHMTDQAAAELSSEARSDILLQVAERWRADIRDHDLQQLVETTAVLHDFNQEKLAFILGEAVPADLFRKLISLSLIKPVRNGWTMHELLRQAIGADLLRREPARHEQVRKQAAIYIYEQLISGHRTEQNVVRFFYYTGDELIRSVMFHNFEIQTPPDLYLEPITDQTLPEVHAYIARDHVYQLPDGTHATAVDFTLPADQESVPLSVTEEHNMREAEMRLALDVDALGPESFHLLKNGAGETVGMANIIPIHRETLPLLRQMPVTRAYFRALDDESLQSYDVPREQPAGLFVRSLVYQDPMDAFVRSYLLYRLFPLLISAERIVVSTPLKLYSQLLQRFGFEQVEGATHFDYGADQPSPTYVLDLGEQRLAAYLKTFVSDDMPQRHTEKIREELDLTEREADVVSLIVQGKSNADIGQALHLAEVTVKKHVSRILHKAGVENRQQLIARLLP